MEQGSALSPILSALYLASVLYILEKHLKTLEITVSILSFVNNGLLIVQSRLLAISNDFLFCSSRVISSLLKKFRLILKHGKTEVFYFSRSNGVFDPPPLDLSMLGDLLLCSRSSWRYLGFIFDRKLFFQAHINYYMNKAISTVKCIKILGNSAHSFIPHQK